jgi:inositol transport system substrate-binding protein
MMKEKMVKMVAVVCLIVVATAFIGCKGKAEKTKVYKVGYSNANDAEFFDKLKRDEFEKIAKSDSSIQVVYTNASQDISLQLDQVDNFIAQKVDAMILCPVDTIGIIPGVEKANAAGIPVICIGTNAGGGISTYVGCENTDAGIRLGKYMAEHLPQNAKVVFLAGIPGYDHSRKRRAGFLDTLAADRPDVTLLAEQTGDYARANGQRLMEDWLQSFPQIDGVIAANDQMALGALEALKGANRASGVLIGGIDAVQEACQAIKNRDMSISILQSAPDIAQGSYDTLKKVQKGESVGSEVIIPFVNVTIDNVDQYL